MRPVLSIGMIFKDEIRCLERCMRALQPLRDAVPCELVMADTGSGDGSRKVAEQYADVLFDFPWINDFAAARNAVMDRCSGEWYLSIDADEWLDGDLSELTEFLSRRELWVCSVCALMVRNYFELDLDGEYSDFYAVRIARLDAGIRFKGAIHEMLEQTSGVLFLSKTLLHHDGYVESIKKEKGKLARNMELLREKLARNPEDLNAFLQCIESSRGGPGHEDYVRRAAAAVERHLPLWEYYGPPILRYAILWAVGQEAPEWERWTEEMLEWFPDSIYTNIDVTYALFMVRMEKGEYAQAVLMGERYLDHMARYQAGEFDQSILTASALVMANELREEGARAILAEAYFQTGQAEKSRETLLSIDPAKMRPETVGNYIKTMMNLYAQGEEDLSPVLADFWEKNGPEKKRGEDCRRIMIETAQTAFFPSSWAAEDEQGLRHAWILFLPLAGKCEIGDAARVLAADSTEEMEAALLSVNDWSAFPVPALARAIKAGAAFPMLEKPLTLEEMDSLAARLAQEPESLYEMLDIVSAQDYAGSWQALTWVRGLALAAVQSCQWEDPEQGMRLARIFAKVERVFLPAYYAPEVLREGNLCVLPPMHRFGWYCAQAFEALESGDITGYVHHLRESLSACEGTKSMVEFLTEHTPQLQASKPSAELLALADQVRTLLSAYDPNDPAVVALKSSPVYQRVAHLIEAPAAPAVQMTL